MKTFLFWLFASLAAPLAAQPAKPGVVLEGDVKVEKVTVVDGARKIELVAPDVVLPGDRLVFTTRYRNAGNQPAENFVVTNAVPAGAALAENPPPSVLVSVDGGKMWGSLAASTVVLADGTTRAALAADVTHLRWVISRIAPQASGELQYHAIVR